MLLWAVVTSAVLLCYLPYGVFAEWWYLRFLLPVLPVTFVVAGALVAASLVSLPPPSRGIVLLLLVTAACACNLVVARHQQAFTMRDFEARYRTAGRYLDGALSERAVVLAVQESSSAHYYAHAPIVRWDLLHADLGEATSTLRGLGREPLLLIEDWEVPQLRRTFPQSPLARLDWRPRADIGDGTHVLLYDLRDRNSRAPYVTDRVH